MFIFLETLFGFTPFEDTSLVFLEKVVFLLYPQTNLIGSMLLHIEHVIEITLSFV